MQAIQRIRLLTGREHDPSHFGMIMVFIMMVLLQSHPVNADEAFEKAYAADAFILSSRNGDTFKIGLDTSEPGMLKLALDIQNTIYAHSGSRPEIHHLPRGPREGVNPQWQLIYLVKEYLSAKAEISNSRKRFRVTAEYLQPGYSLNCPKRICIRYDTAKDAREAMHLLFEKTLGIGLVKKTPTEVEKKTLSMTFPAPDKSIELLVEQELIHAKMHTQRAASD